MLNHLPWNTRHVRRFPSEDVLIFLEEGDERASLFVTEPYPNQSHLGRIARVEHDLFEFLVSADPGLGCFFGWNFSLLLKGGCGEPDAVPLGLCLYVLCQCTTF